MDFQRKVALTEKEVAALLGGEYISEGGERVGQLWTGDLRDWRM